MHQLIAGMNPLLMLFLIAGLGYLLGGIQIKGIQIGTSGVLLVALVFGHFGGVLPALVRNLGLALFVTSVGFTAGKHFFRDFRKNAKSYILLGFLIILSGTVVCALVIWLGGVEPELAVGLLTGALTSTPGLAAAQEAAGELAHKAAVGYAIAYPFGVVGVVLFVQLIPKLTKANMEKEIAALRNVDSAAEKPLPARLKRLSEDNFVAFMIAVVLGILVGDITIPLGNGASFSLGTTGGPLLAGLIFGHLGHAGGFDLKLRKEALETFRELGLMLFLIGAGTNGGAGFLETLQQEGAALLLYGVLMTLVPMLLGFVVAKKMLKMSLLNNLGAITGGMTSTPALGTLISIAHTDDVSSAYAATYPVALVAVVLASQLVVVLF